MKHAPPPSPDLAARLLPVARQTTFSRHRFREFYDGWLTDRRLPGGPVNFVHAVITTSDLGRGNADRLDPARDADALALALAGLGAPAHALECAAAAIAAGLFDPPGQSDPEAGRPTIAAAWTRALHDADTRAILQRGTREALIGPDDFWTDPGDLLPAVLLARRRLCRIEAVDANEDRVTATGFLIGPSAVLTNLHAVRGVPMPLADPERLRVRFDFSETTGLRDDLGSRLDVVPEWRVAAGAIDDGGPDADYWWDDAAERNAWLDRVRGMLDYAVIRLDGTPGLQRGWFNVASAARDKPAGVWVIHHPGGGVHTITTGAVRLTKAGGHRIFHLAPTIGGSSGGLVLDQAGRPVGLHYMALEATTPPAAPEQKTPKINVALSLGTIADDLKARDALRPITEISGVRPFRGCLDGRRPVFGRSDLLAMLERLFRGEVQALMVHVEDREPPLRRPGKSFTIDIVRGLFRPPEHHHIVFRAGEIKVDAYRVAADTVATFAPDLVASLPTSADTTTPAYVRRLVTAVAHAASERLSNRMVWILLDDLDKHDLSDASGREFLATLYSQLGLMPNLRVILIGLPKDIVISGMEESAVLRSFITSDEIDRVGHLFTQWLKERGANDANLTDTSFKFLADVMSSLAGADSPLEELAEFVAQHVTGAADNLFGSARAPEADE